MCHTLFFRKQISQSIFTDIQGSIVLFTCSLWLQKHLENDWGVKWGLTGGGQSVKCQRTDPEQKQNVRGGLTQGVWCNINCDETTVGVMNDHVEAMIQDQTEHAALNQCSHVITALSERKKL